MHVTNLIPLKFTKPSYLALAFAIIFLFSYRIPRIHDREISWDALGYYIHLPATFIQHDPLLNDIGWLEQVNSEKQLSPTLYMIGRNDSNEPMYFFLYGMALFYLPFFLIAHALALIFGLDATGFSMIYIYSLVFGALLYGAFALAICRSIFSRFFSETLTAILLLLMVFGTNYIEHMTTKNLEPVNILFMLSALTMWLSIKWTEKQDHRYFLLAMLSSALAALVKPSEVVVCIVPLLWGVGTIPEAKQRIFTLWDARKHIALGWLLIFTLAAPQSIYWFIKTGHFIFDSYQNPGVGLDFARPHLIDLLFSFRKGWLIYTPIMVFAFVGFAFIWQRKRSIFWAILLYFSVSLYIISSWSEWWYGGGFSIRPLITLYPALFISIGFLLSRAADLSIISRVFSAGMLSFFVFLNLFQWWQFNNWIIDPYAMNKSYYFASFLKTSVTEEDRKLLGVQRDFSGEQEFTNRERYRPTKVLNVIPENEVVTLDSDEEYSPSLTTTFKHLTSKDHLWIEAEFDVFVEPPFDGKSIFLVMTMEHEKGAYGYAGPHVQIDSAGKWINFKWSFLTPEIRDVEDVFKTYVVKQSKSRAQIRNYKLSVFERKDLVIRARG